MNWKRHELGADGTAYLRKRLEGSGPLGEHTATALGARRGTVFTELPAHLAAPGTNFDAGGLFSPGESHVLPDGGGVLVAVPDHGDRRLAELTSEVLRADPDRLLVLEDTMNSPGEVAHVHSRVIASVGTRVYHVFDAGDGTADLFRGIREAGITFVGFGGCFGGVPPALRQAWSAGRAGDGELRALAAHVVFAFTVAYDGEGFVAWRMDGP